MLLRVLLFHSLLRYPSLRSKPVNKTSVSYCYCNNLSASTFMASSVVDCSTLVLCGKSLAEIEAAKAIKSSNTLKLPDNGELSIVLQSELDGENVMRSNFCELPIGSVCVADVQTKGRGRSKNVWESPLGCLLFSFTLQMEDGRIVPLVQYVVSLAITEAVKDICNKNGLPSVDVKIKWPNDLYLNGLKVGGILCTSTYKSKKFNVSAGIGLNVSNEKPTTCLNTELRELSVEAYRFQREDVLATFFNKFETFYRLFIDQGFQSLEELYYKTWLHSGQRVIVQEKNDDNVVEHVVTIQGLTSSGYLLAVGDDSQLCELHPDGNSFDFFKGLVRRKLE
ncbi:biotin--protein ligase 1, chloroplastic isoform X3 [Arachis hypogaea]|uniref:biotin--protein ligase 1, chloroplastic isoform X3 n=1 Tax=Arachis hypogaea TaxID=3818 RepID=UPI003B20C3C4